jgi:hypothetical protein
MTNSVRRVRAIAAFAAVATGCGGDKRDVAADTNTPPFTMLATGQDRPHDIALDDTHVYWANAGDGSIARVAKTGGAVEMLASDQVDTQTIAVDDEYVYWGAGGGVNRAPSSGGVATRVYVPSSIDALALSDNYIVVLHTADGAIAKIGTEFFNFAEYPVKSQMAPVGLAADASRYYWTNQGDGTMWWGNLTSSVPPVSLLVDADAGPARLSLDATSVFWVGQADGTIRKVPKGGGAATVLSTSASGGSFVASAGSHVYFTNDDSGAVLASPKIPGETVVMTDGLDSPLGIAADASGVYVAIATGIIRLEPR